MSGYVHGYREARESTRLEVQALITQIEELRDELAQARDGYVPNGQVIPFRLLAKWLVWLDTEPGRVARRTVSAEDIIAKSRDAVDLVERLKEQPTLPISGAP